jgi:hypothetical protein
MLVKGSREEKIRETDSKISTREKMLGEIKWKNIINTTHIPE